MRFNVEIKVEGQRELVRGFNQVAEISRDFRPVWQEIKPLIFQIERELFNSEGASGKSGKWRSLTTEYSEIKQKKFGSKSILKGSEALFKSLTSDTSDTIFETSEDELVFGSSLPQFRGHLKGNSKTNLPIRKPIDISDRDRERIGRAGRKNLVDRIRKIGFEIE